MKFEPLRTCIACRCKHLKKDLFKIVKAKNLEMFICLDDKYCEGRGYYVCKNNDCVNKVSKKRILNKLLRKEVNADIYNQLGDLKFE